MKKLIHWSMIAFAVVSSILVLFVAFNESYTFRDANEALLVWKKELTDYRLVQQDIPVGFGSVNSDSLPGAVKVGGHGPSQAGNALAIYITPDIFPFLWLCIGGLAISIITMAIVMGLIEKIFEKWREARMRGQTS